MSTDLHERLHEALATAEIPSAPTGLADRIVLHARRTRRRRRVVARLAGAAAVAAAVVTAVVVLDPGPVAETGPATTAPAPVETTAAPLPEARTSVVEGRLRVSTGIEVAGKPLVLVPEVYEPEGRSVVELVAETDPRPSEQDATFLVNTSLGVVGQDPAPGWVVAPVVAADGTSTGEFVAYGFLPDGATDVRLVREGGVEVAGGLVTGWLATDMPGSPAAWGEGSRTVFVVSFEVWQLEGQQVDLEHPDVPGLRVEAGAVGREWQDVAP